MLSSRGAIAAASQNIPWRFAPGGSNRYDNASNPSGVVSFGMAENALVHDELEKYVAENIRIPSLAFTYRFSTMGGTRFPAAMAKHMDEYFKPHSPIKSEDIITAAGLTAIHEMLAQSLGDVGDGLLVARPIYGRFELDFGNTAGMHIVYASTEGIDPFSSDVVERYQRALDDSNAKGVRIKALLIVNPHNPLGRCYPASTLAEIMKFCQQNSIHMISDEVYALSVYDTGCKEAPLFTSVLSLDPTGLIDTGRLHVLYGMSKDFAAAGLRLGCLISQNTLLKKAVAANSRFHGPSGMSIAIGTAILEDRTFVRSFIELCRTRLTEARAYTTGILDDFGIQYAKSGNAGFFVYIDLSPWLPDKTAKGETEDRLREYALAQTLLDRGVGLHPCEEHNEKPGHFRLVFSIEHDSLKEGLKRLTSTLAELPSTKQN